jgi:hypothetical protein
LSFKSNTQIQRDVDSAIAYGGYLNGSGAKMKPCSIARSAVAREPHSIAASTDIATDNVLTSSSSSSATAFPHLGYDDFIGLPSVVGFQNLAINKIEFPFRISQTDVVNEPYHYHCALELHQRVGMSRMMKVARYLRLNHNYAVNVAIHGNFASCLRYLTVATDEKKIVDKNLLLNNIENPYMNIQVDLSEKEKVAAKLRSHAISGKKNNRVDDHDIINLGISENCMTNEQLRASMIKVGWERSYLGSALVAHFRNLGSLDLANN